MPEAEPDPLLSRLRDAGLSRYEASVYLGLLIDQTAKVVEISKRTGVPQPKVYQALDSLVEKGFCILGSDAVNRYQPVRPGVALESLVVRLQTEQEEIRALGRELEEVLAQGRGQELWAPPIEIVKGVRQVSQMLVERIQGARREIQFFGKSPIVRARQVAQALHDAGEAGIELRMVYEDGYLKQDDVPEEVALYREMRGEKRTLSSLPTKLVLIDQEVALVSISRSGGTSFLMLLLRHEGLLAHFRASFERHWESARPL